MPAVAVWAEPPAMPPSGRSDVPDLNSTWSMSSPSPSAAICASGPGALPHVMSPDLHGAAAVAPQPRLGLGLKHERGKRRRAHAPADEQAVIIAHLPGCERTTLPAELPGALRVALAQRLGGERLAGDRLDLGIVREPKGQGIHTAGLRHFIDGAFERNRAGRLAGCAHEQRRADVDPNGFMRGSHGGAG